MSNSCNDNSHIKDCCPFCGSSNIKFGCYHPLEGRLTYCAYCDDCGCQGPSSDKAFSKSIAAKLWNTRFYFSLF